MAGSIKALTKAIRAPFARFYGLDEPTPIADFAYDGDWVPFWRDSASQTAFSHAPKTPTTATFKLAASPIAQVFFIANQPIRILEISEVHSTAGNDAGAVTGTVRKLSGTQTVAQGQNVLASTFNLKGTANTVQTLSATLKSNSNNLQAGDRLAFATSGVLTALAGVVVSVKYISAAPSEDVTFTANLNALAVDSAFFIANRPYVVRDIRYVHGTAGTDVGAVTVHVEKDTGTTAPGSGTTIQSGTFNAKAANNTVQRAVLAALATRTLAVGDRLTADVTGTPTALAGVQLTVSLEAVEAARKEISFNMVANASQADQAFWVSDGEYLVTDIREVHATAGTDGGAVNLQVTKDSGTDAPGAGVNLLTNTAGAGFDLKGTANTVQVGALSATRSDLIVSKGQRISVDYAGTLTTLAGVLVTVSLQRLDA